MQNRICKKEADLAKEQFRGKVLEMMKIEAKMMAMEKDLKAKLNLENQILRQNGHIKAKLAQVDQELQKLKSNMAEMSKMKDEVIQVCLFVSL
jgi:hypothetical protein